MLKASAQTDGSTRDRIVAAALETLRAEGFAGTSARGIARRGGFNQALIFYHFGSVHDLLVEGLDRVSAVRMERYREAVESVCSIDEGVRVATDLYREDLASGHITVLAELIGGSLAHPDLAPRVVERLEPWIELTERAVRNVLGDLEKILPAHDLAYAVVALYLGVDLLSHLEKDDSRAEALFQTARELGELAGRVGEAG
jgi:AcrR family transcriptional regulator